jgi:hypothetical protein
MCDGLYLRYPETGHVDPEFPSGRAQAEDYCQRVAYSWDYNRYDNQWNPPYKESSNIGRLTAVAYGPVNQSGASCIPGIQPTNYQEYYSYYADGSIGRKACECSADPIRISLKWNTPWTARAAFPP